MDGNHVVKVLVYVDLPDRSQPDAGVEVNDEVRTA